jgi:endonuclease G, mitochondrial
MKKIVVSFALLLSSHLALAGQCNYLYAGGAAPVFTNLRMSPKTQELCSSEFVVMHSGVTRGPLWSAEHLTSKQLTSMPPRVNGFHADQRLPMEDRAELKDFARSGYDRGHMSPSGDENSPEAQHESFALSNMVPQNPNNNRQLHAQIESEVRHFAESNGELYVITGPLFIGNNLLQLNHRVMIPTHIYKLVYDPKRHAAAAYLEKNETGYDYKIISVEELNKMAGVNFLPGVRTIALLDLPVPSKHRINYRN